MAGLGQEVRTNWSLRARMFGDVVVNGSNHPAWFFEDITQSTFGASGFMGDRTSIGAHIEVPEGKLIKIDFNNFSSMNHTIHLHGLDVDQQNDGVGTTSFEVPPMGSNTYEFVAPHAGTYHYHCHVDTVLHYVKGMFGTVIVRPPDSSINKAWVGGPTFDEEVLWQTSAVDTTWLDNLLTSGDECARFAPDGFLLNGRQSAAAKNDPYSRIDVAAGKTVYLRLVNSSYLWQRVDLGGLPFDVVASDGRPIPNPINATSWELGPGERYDLMFTVNQAGQWTPVISYLDDYTGGVVNTVESLITVS